ncbi:MAG: hypothetical protein FWE05_13725 [Defluviitaleaceae bacterium]|nr:hypothetical protein [Defluviitaleaceae bacterium]
MTQRCLLLSANTYKMNETKDEEGNVTNPARSGLTVWYYPVDSLADTTNPRNDGTISKGTPPMQASFQQIEVADNLVAVPGVYDFKMQMQAVSQKSSYGGRTTSKMIQAIVPVDINYVSEVRLTVDKPKAS